MNQPLTAIDAELTQIVTAISSVMPDARALMIAHGNNWQFPAVSKEDLTRQTLVLQQRINSQNITLNESQIKILASFPEKLTALRTYTIPQIWSSPQSAVPPFMATMQALALALDEALPSAPDKTELAQASSDLNAVRQRLQTITLALAELEPRTSSLSGMVSRIEQANMTADQLPADLEDLSQKRNAMAELLRLANLEMEKLTGHSKNAAQTVADASVANPPASQ